MNSALGLLLPPWRLGGNIRKNTEEMPIESLSDGAVAAEWTFAFIVIVGVVLERPWPALGVVMVAGGIAAEVFSGVITHLCQSELTRRSNAELKEAQMQTRLASDMANSASVDAANAMQQLSEANRKLGEAIERAANAELEAAKLKSQIAPRSLAGHQDTIAEKIGRWAGMRVEWGADPDLPESQLLCRAIAATLSKAGWVQSPGTPTHQPMYPGGIMVASTTHEEAQAAARALSHAFREAGIFAVSAPMLNGPSARVFVTVGTKPSADDEEQARKTIENIPIAQRP